MRPKSMIAFDILYLGSLLLSLATAVVTFTSMQKRFDGTPGMAAMGGSGVWFYGAMGVSVGVSLLLWYFISRRASVAAKWIMVVFTALGALSLLSLLAPSASGATSPGSTALSVIATLMQVGAAVMLFRQDARAWFEGRGPVDPNVFN